MAKPTSSGEPFVLLRHGTTAKRAATILKNGPDPDFVEPGSPYRAEAFSTAPAQGPYPMGSPEDYVHAKASLYPNEGGAAIVEIDVPKSIVDLAVQPGGEVCFYPGFGLEELIAAWPQIAKRITAP